MKKLHKLHESYRKPTPRLARQIGDGLLLISGIAALFVPGAKWAIAVGMVGKYISNCFSEKK